MGTTFFLIPFIGSRAITITLGAAGLVAGLVLVALFYRPRLRAVAACRRLAARRTRRQRPSSSSNSAFANRHAPRKDGQIAHIESEYNDIYIGKRRTELTMSFQLKGWDYTESVTNLKDPDDLPLKYTRNMTLGVIYPRRAEESSCSG